MHIYGIERRTSGEAVSIVVRRCGPSLAVTVSSDGVSKYPAMIGMWGPFSRFLRKRKTFISRANLENAIEEVFHHYAYLPNRRRSLPRSRILLIEFRRKSAVLKRQTESFAPNSSSHHTLSARRQIAFHICTISFTSHLCLANERY